MPISVPISRLGFTPYSTLNSTLYPTRKERNVESDLRISSYPTTPYSKLQLKRAPRWGTQNSSNPVWTIFFPQTKGSLWRQYHHCWLLVNYQKLQGSMFSSQSVRSIWMEIMLPVIRLITLSLCFTINMSFISWRKLLIRLGKLHYSTFQRHILAYQKKYYVEVVWPFPFL